MIQRSYQVMRILILGGLIVGFMQFASGWAAADVSAAKAHLRSAYKLAQQGEQKVEQQQAELNQARIDSQRKDDENRSLLARNDQLEKAWISPRMSRLLWIAAIAIFGLRAFGIMSTGIAGTIAAHIATGITGVFTFGLSMINSIFDNVWFRFIKPKKDEKDAAAAQAAELDAPPIDGSKAHVVEPDDNQVIPNDSVTDLQASLQPKPITDPETI